MKTLTVFLTATVVMILAGRPPFILVRFREPVEKCVMDIAHQTEDVSRIFAEC